MNKVWVSTLRLRRNSSIPNNPSLPVLVYRKVFDLHTADKHRLFQQCFDDSNWQGVWKNGLYDYHHFHPSSHEVLGIAQGRVDVMLGGEDGKTLTLEAGDAIVLPAGTGHKRVGGSENLVVIGAYPPGQEDYSVCRNKAECKTDCATLIAQVPLPLTDPVYGREGPLLQIWNR